MPTPSQAAGDGFESALNDVMGVGAGQLADVEGAGGIADESQPKFLHQFRVKSADLLGGDGEIETQIAPTGQIHRGEDQRFVHRQRAVAITADAPLVAQGSGEGLTQGDAHILHGVVVIYPGVTLAGHRQIKATVAGEEGQHMVQETAAGGNGALSLAVQVQLQGNVGFRSFTVDRSGSHKRSSMICRMAAMKVSICAIVPMVMRL